MRAAAAAFLCALFFPIAVLAQGLYVGPKTDEYETSAGPLLVTSVYHGSVMFQFGGKVIHVDPWSMGDYSDKPKADLILITHQHRDHLDKDLIDQLHKEGTVLVGTATVAEQVPGFEVLANGDSGTYQGISVEAVPAYNITRERSPGVKFHPKGEGNGYVLTFGDKRVYVAGDTENIPEMAALEGVDIAFLPCNLPYTMTPDELLEAARVIKPAFLYPYHLGNTDRIALAKLLSGLEGIQVRGLEIR
jgi:L-ascorbate metabolism protein UlaG (beta-lactamase superfamily)